MDLDELQGYPEFIPINKAARESKLSKTACMVVDVSLCFNALNGLPGPYIKDFNEGLKADGLVKMLSGF